MTSARHSLSILVANESAEEIKLISASLRGFFRHCRIEAVYTSDDALEWSLKGDWHLFLIDQSLNPRSGIEILSQLKSNNPHAAIILQTDHSDSTTALQALQQGADFLLFKHSPGFATELLFYAQEAIEKRELALKLEHTFQRHLRLVETVSDVIYELDQNGRFIYLSQTVTPLLGYTAEELAGQHFSQLLPSTQHGAASYRFNERRVGTRSTRQLELFILAKASVQGETRKLLMQLTAKGLYGERRQYLGTVGLLRDLSDYRKQDSKVQELEARIRETDRQLAASRNAALASRQLQQPLSALLQDSHRLLTIVRNIQFDQHVTQLAAYATQATHLGHEVWKSIHFKGRAGNSVSLNTELKQLLTELSDERHFHPSAVDAHLGPDVPHIAGSKVDLKELFRILIVYALQSLADSPGGGRLLVETYAVKSPDTTTSYLSPSPSMVLFPYAVIVIRQQIDVGSEQTEPLPAEISASELLRAHEILQHHGGAIEISAPFNPPFQITVRFPGIPSFSSLDLQKLVPSQEAKSVPIMDPPTTTPSSARLTPSSADRRRFQRTVLSLSVDLTIGATAWRGTSLDIGGGGMLLVSAQPTPPIQHQPVYLVLRTAVSFLEIQGTVRDRSPGPGKTDSICFVIEFTPLMTAEAAVLTSFIQSCQQHTATLKIEGLIPDPGGQLYSAPLRPSMQRERRWRPRVNLTVPIHITFASENGGEPQLGRLTNIGRGGACIQVDRLTETIDGRLIIQYDPNSRSGQIASDQWASWNASTRTAWIQTAGEGRQHIGVSFDRLPQESEQRLDYVLHYELVAGSLSGTGIPQGSPGTSLSFLRNRRGQVLALSQDQLTNRVVKNSPILIISPGYAQSRVDYIGLGRHFGSNGYRILRYDATHALGLSDGELRDMTMGTLKDDLETVIEFAREQWPHARIAVLASDLAARAALKSSAQGRMVDMLLLLDPVLNLKAVLNDLHHRDFVDESKSGSRFGLFNLMGCPIDADHFLRDATAGGYMDLASTIHDVRRLLCRVCLLTTPHTGEFLKHSESNEHALTKHVIEALGGHGTAVRLSSSVTDDGHMTSTPRRQAFQEILIQCAWLAPETTTRDDNPEADAAELTAQYRHEVELLRTKPNGTHVRPRDLWECYAKYSLHLCELAVYLQHWTRLYQVLRPTQNRYNVLDVGCGHYGFGRLWLLNEFYRLWSLAPPNNYETDYVGIDSRLDTVRSSRDAFTETHRQIGIVFPGMHTSRPHVVPRWFVGDVAAFPFGDAWFDYVVCHFTLNFSDNPIITLRELYRLLRPKGTLIVTSFTPIADPAVHYRAHVQGEQQKTSAPMHQGILLELAQLREAIRCRKIQSFTSESLAALFSQITTETVLISPSLDNHVLVATVQKPDSIRHI